jgi:hypothetical protein
MHFQHRRLFAPTLRNMPAALIPKSGPRLGEADDGAGAGAEIHIVYKIVDNKNDFNDNLVTMMQFGKAFSGRKGSLPSETAGFGF